MENCIFCKIASGEIPSVKIYEDKEHMAILDINPNMEGMTLVIPKKHLDSYAFDLDDSDYVNILIKAKKIAKILDKSLKVKRTAMVMEGLGVNHLHIKLYPLSGLTDKFEEILSKEKVYFNEYPGYLSTQLGPQKSINELNEVAKKIKKYI